jgi:hypothetical protein
MKTIEDLNKVLFEQVERLIRTDSKDELDFEVSRTRSIVSISAQIVNHLTYLQKIKEVSDKSKNLPLKY